MFKYITPVAALAASAFAAPTADPPVKTTTCNGQDYVYQKLAGYGFLPNNARDKFGDTIGGWGSSAQIGNWRRYNSSVSQGTLYGLPDRGWNTNGTINYQPRVHTFQITLFTDAIDTATVANPSPPNLKIEYQDTVLLRGPDGAPCTGLDADAVGYFKYPGFPDLPVATYPGDGFGGAGPGGRGISIDAEGLVLAEDNNFWISDEYGPYIYKFDHSGLMTRAIRAPDALEPLRNGTVSYSANSPPRYDPNRIVVPAVPTQGRQNNQGFEGLTWSPDGVNLYALLQSAATQEGGLKKTTRQYTRLVQYQIATGIGKKNQLATPVQVAEYVVPLPTYTDVNGKAGVAAQSEMHFISDTQFFFLPRDSGAGHGQPVSTSVYRHIDIFDISAATNISGTYDAFNSSIASSAGVLKAGIVPATVCPFIDFNINSQLNRFGVHNGGAQDQYLLNEKWESIALATVTGGRPTGADYNDEYYVFSFSDNDFVTQDGYYGGGKYQYSDLSGYNLDNQALVFKVTLPSGTMPLIH